MGLNKSKGNMYDFITDTWNTVKGQCYHDCKYCYMKKWGNLKPIRFDKKEFKTDLGEGKFIFVGSGNDMFAENIPSEWIKKTLNHCFAFNNKYLFQSKNPSRFLTDIAPWMFDKIVLCTTLETNRNYPGIMQNSPSVYMRPLPMAELCGSVKTYITIEPIMDFDLEPFVYMVESCKPAQVKNGANSGGNNLPEPSPDKIIKLISELENFTKVKTKINLKRLMNNEKLI